MPVVIHALNCTSFTLIESLNPQFINLNLKFFCKTSNSTPYMVSKENKDSKQVALRILLAQFAEVSQLYSVISGLT